MVLLVDWARAAGPGLTRLRKRLIPAQSLAAKSLVTPDAAPVNRPTLILLASPPAVSSTKRLTDQRIRAAAGDLRGVFSEIAHAGADCKSDGSAEKNPEDKDFQSRKKSHVRLQKVSRRTGFVLKIRAKCLKSGG